LSTKRSELSRVSTSTFLALAALLFYIGTARAQVVPYITDIDDEENVKTSIVKGSTENGELRFLGTFKLFNPDTIPFYLWVSFENNGQLTKTQTRAGHSNHRSPSIRLMDMELHYRDALQRPVVKVFPKRGAFGGPPVRRSGWGSSTLGAEGNVGRFGKKKPHERQIYSRQPDYTASPASDDASLASVRRRAGGGAVEIAFWREDVQSYYEMELWGVLYAPDVQAASAAGRYIEKINFEIEPAR